MFRTHPPRFALASVAIWCLLCLLSVPIVWQCRTYAPAGIWYLAVAHIALIAALGMLLWMHLPRALQWRARSSKRPHPMLQAERQRIARDLHDQIGSQLVGAMALLDPAMPPQKLALRALEQCLLDLRLVVDSMDSTDESLPDRLARLRHRLQPVLQHRGIVLAWEVDCTCHEHLPDGDQVAHLAHIVQEALSNMLQHSHATRVQIRLAHLPHQQAWHLEVTDNGIGLPSDLAQGAAGKGLASMLARAQMAHCQLQLLRGTNQGGTCVRIVLPCARCIGNAGVRARPMMETVAVSASSSANDAQPETAHQ